MISEETKKEDKQDHFSDEDPDDTFQVNVDLVKNRTTTSNFKLKIQITNEQIKTYQNRSHQNSKRNTRLSKKDFLENHKEENEKIKESNNIHSKKNDNTKNDNSTTIFENSSMMRKNLEGSGSENDIVDGQNSDTEIKNNPPMTPNSSIYSFYQKLRDKYEQTGELFEDEDFPCDQSIFCSERENPDGEFEIEFERPSIEEDGISFFTVEPHPNGNYNIEHEFKITRGILNDKFFIGAVLMLFQKYNEYFTNLVLDYEHVNENLKAGFCGFQFFVDGEWKPVTIDTRLPAHQRGEYSLSRALTPKSPFWISLFEKAYAKLFGSYSVLNDTLLKDFLVDFTGGWSKMIKIQRDSNNNIDDKVKKFYFDEITRCISQGYLIGCMKYDEDRIKEELNESVSDKDGGEDEQILSNTIYTIINIAEYENLKLIFLCNHWDKGKFLHKYGPEDETWEANKKLTEKLEYTVSTTDGTFWMLFDDFISSYNTLYYCRIFPEEWASYTIPGLWAGESSGGSPQATDPWFPEQRITVQNKLAVGRMGTRLASNLGNTSIVPPKMKTSMKKNTNISSSDKSTTGAKMPIKQQPVVQVPQQPKPEVSIQCDFKRNIITDTEEAFFLNPQYKIEIKHSTKIIISLMQKDQKLNSGNYVKINFMVVFSKGRYSRIWDLDEKKLIKKAINDKEDGNRREIVMNLDSREIIKKYNSQNMKKLPINKDHLYINLIPYLEYTAKYEIEKKGNQRIFKPYHPDANYWLRIFSNEDIYINELKRPFETKINGNWGNITSGGPRFIINKKKYVENPHWPNNPQYMIKFDGNVKCKIILRKVTGHFANEETKVGLILTKPSYYDEDKEKLVKNQAEKHQIVVKEKKKLEPIERIINSTNKILTNKEVDIGKIFPKLSINHSELVYESSYNNTYCASIQITLSKLDSPMILIPTLSDKSATFDYEMKIFSNKLVEIFPLFGDKCAALSGEWNEKNAGGSHMTAHEEEEKPNLENEYKARLTYLDNPKFILQFDSKDWIKNLEFEVIVSRMNSIWKRRLSQSMINSMMSCYIFKNERDGKWKDNCENKNKIDFMPKDSVSMKFFEKRADPKGYILMPITYAKNVYGPFNILVKSNEKFILREVNEDDDIK